MDAEKLSLDRLHAFMAVAETSSFTAAAKRLGVGKNAVSQKVAKLEKELGIPLFLRTTRQVAPTDRGDELYRACVPLLRNLQSTLEKFGEPGVAGSLRITAPLDFAQASLCSALVELGATYPDLQIELIADSNVRDLVADRIDVGVRLGWPRSSSLRAVKVGEFSLVIAASPQYLAEAGVPAHPQDLALHRWVAFSALPQPTSWRFMGPHNQRSSVRVGRTFAASTAEGVLALVRQGAGMSVLTDFSAQGDLHAGSLQPVLAEWRLPRGGIYLTWPSMRQESPKVRAAINFLRKWFELRKV